MLITKIVASSIALLLYLLGAFYHLDKGEDDTAECVAWVALCVAGIVDLTFAWAYLGAVNTLNYWRMKCLIYTTCVLWVLGIIDGIITSHKNSDSNVWVFIGFVVIETAILIVWVWYLFDYMRVASLL